MTAVNVEGTRSLLESLKKRSDPVRFIYLSSAGVTGQGKYLQVDERTPCLPTAVYEKTKLEAEIIVNDYCSRNGILGRILRPTIVFGEGKAYADDSFYQLIRRIKSGKFFLINRGKGIANYVYVGDVVNALIAFMKDDRPGYKTYILNDETDMLTLVGGIKDALGMHSGNLSLPYAPVLLASKVISFVHPEFPLTPARVRAMACQFHFSSEKIKNELGFKFEYGIAEGVKRTVSWLRQENRL
jgi:nucleoside-diphosphate-sugar epimerase